MTQKHILTRALDFAQLPFAGNICRVKAARASCIISWLHDMNWHAEADALEHRVGSMPHLARAFEEIKADHVRVSKLEYIASLLNCICGHGLEQDEWRATEGAALVEELWPIINGSQPAGL
jgi:hypothetical protein